MISLHQARRVKHTLFLARRQANRRVHGGLSQLRRAYSIAAGYSYDPQRYTTGGVGDVALLPTSSTFPVDHLWYPSALPVEEAAPALRRLHLLWTGDNPLTPNRRRSVEALRRANEDVEVVLITPRNLSDFVVAGHPLHAAYEALSLVHRSDYLRAYLMYHHGGAYLDVKPYAGRVSAFFDVLDRDPHLWAVGLREHPDNVTPARGGVLGRDQVLHARRILAQSAFAFRPRTRLAAEWIEEVDRRMDYFSTLLERRPARDPLGSEGGYPVPWFSLLGGVFSPLCLKHLDRVRATDLMTLDVSGFDAYR